MKALWVRAANLGDREFPMRSADLISIVDDDNSIREATKGLVRSLGYRAAAFASAEEFLRSGSVDETSCLITDVRMPGLGGIELQQRLIAQGHPVPTIFITAFPEESARRSALAAGALRRADSSGNAVIKIVG